MASGGGQRDRESFTERDAQCLEVGSQISKEENDGLENSLSENKQCEQAYTRSSLTADLESRH